MVSRLKMVVLVVVLTAIGVLGSYPGGTTTALAASDVGYRDFSFAANAVTNPTGEKPQSKLWFNDGVWWASLFDRSTEEYHIYRYDWPSHTWNDTGTLIDERNSSKADTLWDGNHLYVVSAGTSKTNTSHGARILRYTYDSATKKYTLDQGFPVTITSVGSGDGVVLDKDTSGKLWVTYEQDKQIYVNRTLSDDRTWGTPFVLPVKGTTVTSDDTSAVVSFDGQIGVMWSNQIDDAMYFATHKDGDPDNAWQGSRAAIQGPKNADDHISLRSLQAADSSGRVFAAVKTSLNDVQNPNPNAPLNLLLVRDRDGNWTNHVFGRVGDDHTRPILMLDEEHRDLYMFATAPCCAGGAIYYKKTNLNNVAFSEGRGEPFIQSSTDLNINDATSTKQNVSSTTGLVVMASSGQVVSGSTGSGYYWHNAVKLGGVVDNIPPETSIASGPSGAVDDSSASFVFSSTEPDSTFECALDGAPFSACTSSQDYTGLSDGSHTFRVRATDAAGNTDTTPAERSWMVDTAAPSAPLISDPADNSYNKTSNVTVSGTAEANSTVELFERTTSKGTTQADASGDWSKTLTGVAEGSHTYTAKATDSAGNTSAASNARTVIVDTTLPETAIDVGPSGTVNSTSPSFEFSSNEPNASFECKLDGAAFESCTSPKGYSNLSDGSYTFQVRAIDAAGNTDTTPASRTWKVDTIAPVVGSVAPAGGAIGVAVVNNVEATFSEDMDASAINGSTFTLTEQGTTVVVAAAVSYDGAAKKATLNPDMDLQAEATYVATVKGGANGVKDSAGNPLAADRSWSFTTEAPPPPSDTTKPTIALTTPADGTTYSLNQSVNASYSCQDEAGGSGLQSCTGTVPDGSAIDTASTGIKTFAVTAIDNAGNRVSVTHTYSVADTTPPETAIDSGPSGTVNVRDARFEISSSEPNSTFECSLDGGAFTGCASPKNYTGLSDGSHTFQVRATDAAGNIDTTPAERSWTVDTTAPAVQPPAHSFMENSTLGTSTVPVKLTWSATDDSGVAGYQLQQSTNGGAYKNVSLPSATATTIMPSLTPGNTYQFQVRAQDQVGNWSSWRPGPRFQVDAYQESDAAVSYVDLWTTQTLKSAYGGALKYSQGIGTEKATFVFTGSEVAWVAPTNIDRGQADVYLDGTKVVTVDLYSASGKSRTVVFAKAGLDPSVPHTLEVRVLGTKNPASKAKRVDVDAFIVLR